MKKLSFVLLAAAIICFLSSCRKVVGEGPIETENRQVNNFTGIAANIGCDVYFTQAPEFKVEIIAQRNILNLIETYRSGNDLILRFKNNVNVGYHSDIRVSISAPSLENLKLSGSGNVHVTGNFEATQFNTALSGSGNLTIDHIKVSDTLTASISGSGNIRVLAGMANAKNVKISGSGFIDLSAVKSVAAKAKICGSGTAKVNVTQKLDVTMSGSGNVYYFGNPVINTHISGSGKVVRL